nr:hypothetical protein [Streptomyces sp. MK5]
MDSSWFAPPGRFSRKVEYAVDGSCHRIVIVVQGADGDVGVRAEGEGVDAPSV